MRAILFILICLPLSTLACGVDSKTSLPHRFEFSKGAILNSKECHPLRIKIPTKYKSSYIESATLSYFSPQSQVRAFEIIVDLKEVKEEENTTQISMCLNYEFYNNMVLELGYKHDSERKANGDFSFSCHPTFVIDDFASHLESS